MWVCPSRLTAAVKDAENKSRKVLAWSPLSIFYDVEQLAKKSLMDLDKDIVEACHLQGCIKYFIFWDHKANKNIFCMQTLGILCLNLITKQNSVHSMHHFIRFETKIDVFYPARSGFYAPFH